VARSADVRANQQLDLNGFSEVIEITILINYNSKLLNN